MPSSSACSAKCDSPASRGGWDRALSPDLLIALRCCQQREQSGRSPMNRRELIKAAAALPLASIPFSNPTYAQAAYPSRNVTMIVPFPPGGQADLAARPVAMALERILG